MRIFLSKGEVFEVLARHLMLKGYDIGPDYVAASTGGRWEYDDENDVKGVSFMLGDDEEGVD